MQMLSDSWIGALAWSKALIQETPHNNWAYKDFICLRIFKSLVHFMRLTE